MRQLPEDFASGDWAPSCEKRLTPAWRRAGSELKPYFQYVPPLGKMTFNTLVIQSLQSWRQIQHVHGSTLSRSAHTNTGLHHAEKHSSQRQTAGLQAPGYHQPNSTPSQPDRINHLTLLQQEHQLRFPSISPSKAPGKMCANLGPEQSERTRRLLKGPPPQGPAPAKRASTILKALLHQEGHAADLPLCLEPLLSSLAPPPLACPRSLGNRCQADFRAWLSGTTN